LGILSGIIQFWKLNYRIPDPRHWIEDFAVVVIVIVKKLSAWLLPEREGKTGLGGLLGNVQSRSSSAFCFPDAVARMGDLVAPGA
jgi:hypothetical protein